MTYLLGSLKDLTPFPILELLRYGSPKRSSILSIIVRLEPLIPTLPHQTEKLDVVCRLILLLAVHGSVHGRAPGFGGLPAAELKDVKTSS